MSSSRVLVRPRLDPDGDRIGIEHWQDVEDIVERNKGLQSLPQRSDWGRHIATIPNVILVRWMNEEHARGNRVMPFTAAFDDLVARKLRDPEWAYLRTDSQAVQGWMGFGS
ncbi:MAG TPA: hypothetical protein VGL62_16255 [Vicinamibacterales bacterium]